MNKIEIKNAIEQLKRVTYQSQPNIKYKETMDLLNYIDGLLVDEETTQTPTPKVEETPQTKTPPPIDEKPIEEIIEKTYKPSTKKTK
jgi:hypothetical protein